MSSTQALIQLLGAVALMLWGLYMVRSGVIRGFGANLRYLISQGLANRYSALLAGMGVTMIVQSSTATALIVASFTSRGLMDVAMALSVMLGADVATTLVAQILSFDLSFLSPLLILVGVIVHKSFKGKVLHSQLGRAAIGLGLMLLALSIIVKTSEPMRDSEVLLALFTSLGDDPLIAIILTALLTWVAHSSLAMVLLVMSFAAAQLLPVPLALVMVLGANLGGVLPPIMATLKEGVRARRVTFGNAAFKIIGVLACLPLLDYITPALAQLSPSASSQVVNFHMAFNLTLALVFIFLTPVSAKILKQILPTQNSGTGSDRPHFLDTTALETPVVALNCASREALRMGEYVQTMIQGMMVSLQKNDPYLAATLIEMDDLVDQSYEDIKLYISKTALQEVGHDESHRIAEILSFTTNLEHSADIIENLLEKVIKLSNKQLRFSDEGLADIGELHAKVSTNLKLAMTVFMDGDLTVARQLIEEKRLVNAFERKASERHMERLRQRNPETVESSAIHIDMLSDLRRFHSHIAAIAYPILESAGELRKSRLKKRPKKSVDDVEDA